MKRSGGDTHQEDGLPGHPAYGQHGTALNLVVVVGVDDPAHAEVGDFDQVTSANKAVPAEETVRLGFIRNIIQCHVLYYV